MLRELIFLYYHSAMAWLIYGYNSREFVWETDHCFYRRFGDKYKRKRKVVKSLWLVVLCAAAAFPLLPVIFTLALFTTFLSFSVLDESE